MAPILEATKLSRNTLQEILNACAIYFPVQLGLDDHNYFTTQTPVAITGFENSFSNQTEFQNYVQTITNSKNIRDAYKVLYETWEAKPQEITATLPQKEQLETLQAEAEIQRAKAEKAKAAAKTRIEALKKSETKKATPAVTGKKSLLDKILAGLTREKQTTPPPVTQPVPREAVPEVPEITGTTLPSQPIPTPSTTPPATQPLPRVERSQTLLENFFKRVGKPVVTEAPTKTPFLSSPQAYVGVPITTPQEVLRAKPPENIPVVNLELEERETLTQMGQDAVKNTPEFKNTIKSRIEAVVAKSPHAVSETITSAAIDKTATEITDRFVKIGQAVALGKEVPAQIEIPHPASTIAAVTADDPVLLKTVPDLEERTAIADSAAITVATINQQQTESKTLAEHILPKKFAAVLYGADKITPYELVEGPTHEDLPAVNLTEVRHFGETVTALSTQLEQGEIEAAAGTVTTSQPPVTAKVVFKSTKNIPTTLEKTLLTEIKPITVSEIHPEATITSVAGITPESLATISATLPSITPYFSYTPTPSGETVSPTPAQEFIKTRQELITKIESAQKEVAGKTIYAKVVLPEPLPASSLNPTEQKQLQELTDFAKSTPNQFVESLALKIEDQIPETVKQTSSPEEIKQYSQTVALKVAQNLRDGNPAGNPEPMVLAKLATDQPLLEKAVPQSEARLTVTQAATDTAILKMLPEHSQRETLNNLYGPNITNQILGPDIRRATITLSENPEGTAYQIPLSGENGLLTNYQNIVQGPAFSDIQKTTPLEFKSRLYEIGQQKLLKSLSSFPADSVLGKLGGSEKFQALLSIFNPSQTFEATNLFGNIILKLSPEIAPVLAGVGKLAGINLGIIPASIAPAAVPAATLATEAITTGTAPVVTATTEEITKFVAKGAIGKGLMAIATKIGLAPLIESIATFFGSLIPIPIVGQILGFISGWLLAKIVEPILKWIKKHQEDLKILGTVGIVGGALIQSIPMMVFGGLIFIPTTLKTGLSLSKLAWRMTRLARAFSTSLFILFGTPVIVAFICIPILVALILFIINSGAYLVPPSASTTNSLNPYIGITKTANPTGPLTNSQLPLSIEYVVTITAKKGPLTNIQPFEDNCTVVKRGASLPCPSPHPSFPTPPDQISPSNPLTFSYTMDFTGAYADTLIINNLTVTADTPDQNGVTANFAAPVVIGNPPDECPNNAWPLANGVGLGLVIQGPMAPAGCTHYNTPNAIDIAVNGATVIATHSGVVHLGVEGCGSKYIMIASNCGGSAFSSYYGHLGAILVSEGQAVTMGQTIAISDNTGYPICSSGPHIHFQFFDTVQNIPDVQKPYLVRNIPVGCCSTSTCGN